MSNMKLVIFDCDGTLTDTENLNNQATVDVLHAYGYTHYDLEFCLTELIGLTMTAVKAIIEEREGHRLPDDFIQRFIDLVGDRMKDGLQPVAGAVEAVATLDKKFKTCVASNGERENVMTSLRVIQLFDHFGEGRIFTKIQVPRGKPFPDLFLFAADKMGVAPHQCYVIEDSLAGVQAGVAAGMHTIGITAASHDKEAAARNLRAAGAAQVFQTWSEIVNYISVAVDE